MYALKNNTKKAQIIGSVVMLLALIGCSKTNYATSYRIPMDHRPSCSSRSSTSTREASTSFIETGNAASNYLEQIGGLIAWLEESLPQAMLPEMPNIDQGPPYNSRSQKMTIGYAIAAIGLIGTMYVAINEGVKFFIASTSSMPDHSDVSALYSDIMNLFMEHIQGVYNDLSGVSTNTTLLFSQSIQQLQRREHPEKTGLLRRIYCADSLNTFPLYKAHGMPDDEVIKQVVRNSAKSVAHYVNATLSKWVNATRTSKELSRIVRTGKDLAQGVLTCGIVSGCYRAQQAIAQKYSMPIDSLFSVEEGETGDSRKEETNKETIMRYYNIAKETCKKIKDDEALDTHVIEALRNLSNKVCLAIAQCATKGKLLCLKEDKQAALKEQLANIMQDVQILSNAHEIALPWERLLQYVPDLK